MVGVVSKLSDCVRLHTITYEQFFQTWLAVWWIWKMYVDYCSMFSVDDLVFKLYTGIFALGCVSLIINCASWNNTIQAEYFSITIFFIHMLLFYHSYRAYFHVYVDNPKATHRHRHTVIFHIMNVLARDLISAIIWLFAFLMIRYNWLFSVRVILWIATLVPPTFVFLMGMRLEFQYHIHQPVNHLNERIEAFTLIVLGETINGFTRLKTVTKEQHVHLIWTVFSCFGLLFFVKIFHFDVTRYIGEIHAARQGVLRKYIWEYSTILEGSGMALMGAAIAEFCTQDSENRSDLSKSETLWLLSFSVTLILGVNLVAKLAHRQKIGSWKYSQYLWVFSSVSN
eukprot:UN23645